MLLLPLLSKDAGTATLKRREGRVFLAIGKRKTRVRDEASGRADRHICNKVKTFHSFARAR